MGESASSGRRKRCNNNRDFKVSTEMVWLRRAEQRSLGGDIMRKGQDPAVALATRSTLWTIINGAQKIQKGMLN